MTDDFLAPDSGASSTSDEMETSSQPSTSTGITHAVATPMRMIISSSSESDDSDDEEEPAAKKTKTSPSGITWSENEFRPFIHSFDASNAGIKSNFNRESSVWDFFLVFFTESLVTYF